MSSSYQNELNASVIKFAGCLLNIDPALNEYESVANEKRYANSSLIPEINEFSSIVIACYALMNPVLMEINLCIKKLRSCGSFELDKSFAKDYPHFIEEYTNELVKFNQFINNSTKLLRNWNGVGLVPEEFFNAAGEIYEVRDSLESASTFIDNITKTINKSLEIETHLIKDKNMNQQNALSSLFPNFVSLINESAIYLKNLEKSNDNSIKLEYKVPILTFGQVMGYDFYTIEKDENNYFYYYQYRISKNGGSPIYSSKKRIIGDQSIDRYKELFQEILIELMSNSNFRSIATGGF